MAQPVRANLNVTTTSYVDNDAESSAAETKRAAEQEAVENLIKQYEASEVRLKHEELQAVRKVLNNEQLIYDELKLFYTGMTKKEREREENIELADLETDIKLSQLLANSKDCLKSSMDCQPQTQRPAKRKRQHDVQPDASNGCAPKAKQRRTELLTSISYCKSLDDMKGVINDHLNNHQSKLERITNIKNELVITVLKLDVDDKVKIALIGKINDLTADSKKKYKTIFEQKVDKESAFDVMFRQKASAKLIGLVIDTVNQNDYTLRQPDLLHQIIEADHFEISDKTTLTFAAMSNKDNAVYANIQPDKDGNYPLHRAVVLTDQTITARLVCVAEVALDKVNKEGKAAHQVWREHKIQQQLIKRTTV